MFVGQKLSHRWPEDYLQCLLQFLALDTPSKLAYLPPKFEETLFHMGEADMSTDSPLVFVVQLAQDCCKAAWFQYEDERRQLLIELHRLLEVMSFSKDIFMWNFRIWDEHKDRIWDLVARLARMALSSYGWPVAVPAIPCSVLLNEWSSGAYSGD